MNEPSVVHGSYVVERVSDASPVRVFAAWSDPDAKAHWWGDPDPPAEFDFRVGGWERRQGTLPDGREYAFHGLYQDIVVDRRIVYTYDMLLDGIRSSVSLATVELEPEGDGTRLTFTEHGAFLDGHEPPSLREQG